MSRLPAVNPDLLDPAQRVVYDAIANGPRKGVRGPLAVWLHRPQLADRAQALGQYCRYDSSLPPRLSELAILLLGRHWLAEYEWAAHKPFALEAGLSIDVIDAIRDGRAPDFVNADEAAVYAFITQLHATRGVDDAVYAQAIDILGQDSVVDLVGVAGYYTLISMTIKVFNVPPPAGAVPEMPTSLDHPGA
jgi:4-carboxymuconolactone decarboxylase